MKAQCPNCKKILSVPDVYEGKRIKCNGCKKTLIAVEYVAKINSTEPENKTVPKTQPTAKNNVFTRIWTNSPVAFRTAFLSTLGVISALLLVYYLFGIRRWFKPPLQTAGSPSIQANSNIYNNSINTDLLACTVIMYKYHGSLDTLRNFIAASLNLNDTNYLFGTFLRACLELDKLYTEVANVNTFNNLDLISLKKSILTAIDAESIRVNTLLKALDSYRESGNTNLSKNDAEDKGQQADEKALEAFTQLMIMFEKIHPEIVKSFVKITKEK
ncbi:MAG: hypothetical protein ACYSSI_07600 [Planctomycetota bacterium]